MILYGCGFDDWNWGPELPFKAVYERYQSIEDGRSEGEEEDGEYIVG